MISALCSARKRCHVLTGNINWCKVPVPAATNRLVLMWLIERESGSQALECARVQKLHEIVMIVTDEPTKTPTIAPGLNDQMCKLVCGESVPFLSWWNGCCLIEAACRLATLPIRPSPSTFLSYDPFGQAFGLTPTQLMYSSQPNYDAPKLCRPFRN